MKKILLIILVSQFVLGQTESLDKADFKVLSIDINTKQTSPHFSEASLIKTNIKSLPWLIIEVNYEIKNKNPKDNSNNILQILGDFVAINPVNKKEFYVFSKTLSYSTVPKRGVFYAVYLITPRAIENYFSTVGNLYKNLYGRFKFKVNGKTFEKIFYLSKGRVSHRNSTYAEGKYASELAQDISDILLNRLDTPWRNVQYDLFNQLDKQ